MPITCPHELTSSLHCFWHIWQYQRSFWRPLALIRFPIALGLRKSAFPILISQKKSRFTEKIITVPVSQLFPLFLALWLWRGALALSTHARFVTDPCVSLLSRDYDETSFCALFAHAQTGSWPSLNWTCSPGPARWCSSHNGTNLLICLKYILLRICIECAFIINGTK